jgi:hypothetical protein
MQITADDAAFVYARACRSWYGRGARRKIMSQMEELRDAGDPRALRICKLIADELSKLDAEGTGERAASKAPAGMPP